MEIKSTFNLESFKKIGAKANNEFTYLESIYIPSIPFNEILYTFYEGKLTAFKVLYWERLFGESKLNYLIEFPNQKRIWLKGFINESHPIYKSKEDYINETITNKETRLNVKFNNKNLNKQIKSSYYISQGEICVKATNMKHIIGNDKDIFIGLEHNSNRFDTQYFNSREECMQTLLNDLEIVEFAPIHQPTLFDFDDTFIQKSITRTIKIVEITSKKQML